MIFFKHSSLANAFPILWDRQIWLGSQRGVLFIAIIYMRTESFQILKYFEGFFVCWSVLFFVCHVCTPMYFVNKPVLVSPGCLLPQHNTGARVAYTQKFIFLRLTFDQLASVVSSGAGGSGGSSPGLHTPTFWALISSNQGPALLT